MALLKISDEQLKVLLERIKKEELGQGGYYDAREVIAQIKNSLKMSSSVIEIEVTDKKYHLTNKQKKELDLMEEQYSAGSLKTYSWKAVKKELKNKLKK